MGIPGFYRWLVERYPNTLCDVAEKRSPYVTGPRSRLNEPNPNGVEFDNFYIDMNGVIHPCFHPEGGLTAPESYDAVFTSIFRYVDRIFSIVRPRKLLFLAVDGVAPRAKMNHQRIRRFRAAKEAARKISAAEVEELSKSESDKKLDSNVITPGTEFMDLLSSALRYYVHMRMNEDPGWKNIKVILSDSSVVGEGEHKIMSYIRSQRNLPGYDPNTRHCLHGLDADLIMLALATHEIHFSILREVPTYGRISISNWRRDNLDSKSFQKPNYNGSIRWILHDLKFEFFNIWVLREYLEQELLPNVTGTDFERLVDDFVFMCLFVGNDFLPHLPSLDIYEHGIELLLIVYQEEFSKMGYLTDSFKVNLKCMEHFLQALSSHENSIFLKRGQYDQQSHVELESIAAPNPGDVDSTSKEVKGDKNYYLKQRYYTEQFDCKSDDFDGTRKDAVLKYTEGVCWVMRYYYQGVCSWQWFYPYHYAPFASDFCGLDKMEIHFTLGQPFKPLDQLLAVLPAASAHALPLFYRELMTEASSPILDLYPKDAKIDMNGKKREWQGVCKLPFIEESRLLSEIVKVEHTLTDEERQRNRLGRDTLFVHCKHPLADTIKNHRLSDPGSEFLIKIEPKLSGGMNGYLCISDISVHPNEIPSPVNGNLTLKRNSVKSVDFKCPPCYAHIPKLPCGVRMPPKILRCQDFPNPPVAWHATPGPSRTVFSESPITERETKKGKQGEVEMSSTLKHENKGGMSENHINSEAGEGKKNGINGKLEAEVELVTKQGEIRVENGDKIYESGVDEKLKDETKRTDSGGEHEPKRKHRKKARKEAQVDLVDDMDVEKPKMSGNMAEHEVDAGDDNEGCEKPMNGEKKMESFVDNYKGEETQDKNRKHKRRNDFEGADEQATKRLESGEKKRKKNTKGSIWEL